MIDFVRVGETIAALRRCEGMSQDDLAEKLYVTRQALSKWERGVAVPSIDSLFEMCRLFGVRFEEILCIEEVPLEIDEKDIFRGHDRAYIISKIASGEIKLDLTEALYQMTLAERMYILRQIKCGNLSVDREELYMHLTPSEQRFLGEEVAYLQEKNER